MSNSLDVLWLNASPSLKGFDRPLLQYLCGHVKIAQWEYCQTQDEARGASHLCKNTGDSNVVCGVQRTD